MSIISQRGKSCVLVIPDIHEPFGHPDAYAFLRWAKAKYTPDKVVCLGDEVDMHALSNYDKDPDGHSAGRELKLAIERLKEMYALFPEALVCTSNHTSRPYRKAFQHGIPSKMLQDYRTWLEAPSGWHWADEWEIDNVRYEHGEGSSGRVGALNTAIKNMQSTVIGHLHSMAGIEWHSTARHLIFGFNAGCLIDAKAYAFAYQKKAATKPVLGVGVVNRGIPTFVPLLTDSSGRWVRR